MFFNQITVSFLNSRNYWSQSKSLGGGPPNQIAGYDHRASENANAQNGLVKGQKGQVFPAFCFPFPSK